APVRALDSPFSDPIGVVDRRIAHIEADAHFSPYRGGGPPGLQAQLRNELLSRNPRFIALVAYIPRDRERVVAARVDADPETTLLPFLRANSYSHGIPDDDRFRTGFRFVAWWRR